MTSPLSVLIENYQAPLGLDDSLIGNGFKALKANKPFSIVCFAQHKKSPACGEQ
jgi:hypothetical protein